MPTVQPVSMRDLLAACAAADAVSRPPRPEPAEGAPAGRADAAAWECPAATDHRTPDTTARHTDRP
ncbi:hypothetical protein [Streptomyces sp. NPDC004658]|uniref:hypothetical protein n=1 Tax=Streptomyces sp. NPDC004658 TaxID=3154672 RepID=UPI0033BCF80A